MRRSICYSEPKYALAGQPSFIRFTYSPANNLPKGTRIKFDPLSKGREIDWQIPATNLKESDNLIWLQAASGTKVSAKAIQGKSLICPQFEFVLPSEIKAGEEFCIYFGSDEKNGRPPYAQHHVQRRRPFHLYIDPKGKGDYKEPEVFTIDVKGNRLENIRVIAPSLVMKNERFDIVVRFEDCFGNLTSHAEEGTLIELSYDQLRENLNWKLFVPETGFINLPNLYFNEPGIYRIKLLNTFTKKTFLSDPIYCIEAEEKRSLYWGSFHGESDRYDASQQIESCLRYFRDDSAYHFYGSSSFENEEETSADVWKGVTMQVAEFNEEDRFITYLGMQWFHNAEDEGLRQLVFSKDNKPLLRKKESKSNNLRKIYKSHVPKELIGIPSFTMAKGFGYNFEEFCPEYEPVVEIYNAWGSSECTKKEGNLKPITGNGKGIEEYAQGSIRNALNKGLKFGFVAGGLDDRGVFAGLYQSSQVQYTPGVTAIVSDSQSRDSLFNALRERRCYATTGARIILDMQIASKSMGSILSTKSKPGLCYNRYISGYVIGTSKIKKAEIFRNGETLKEFTSEENSLFFEFDEMEPLEKKLLTPANKEQPPFTYYYLRVQQEDGHVAWCSPIWIEHPPQQVEVVAPIVKKVKPKNGI